MKNAPLSGPDIDQLAAALGTRGASLVTTVRPSFVLRAVGLLLGTATSGVSVRGGAKTQGRACLMASLFPAVILNSISMAKSSPSSTL